MSRNKKDAMWPGFRMPKEIVEKGKAAYEKLGIEPAPFRRQFLENIIRIAESDERPAVPARVLTEREMRLPMLIDMPEISDQVIKAAEKLGLDISGIRLQIALDFIRLAEAGERPSMPVRMLTEREARLISIPGDFSKRFSTALGKLGLDRLLFRLQVITDFIRIIESGERPVIPARMMTEKERESLERQK